MCGHRGVGADSSACLSAVLERQLLLCCCLHCDLQIFVQAQKNYEIAHFLSTAPQEPSSSATHRPDSAFGNPGIHGCLYHTGERSASRRSPTSGTLLCDQTSNIAQPRSDSSRPEAEAVRSSSELGVTASGALYSPSAVLHGGMIDCCVEPASLSRSAAPAAT